MGNRRYWLAASAAAMMLGQARAADTPPELLAEAARFEHGEGVLRDYPKALALYCRAARAGSADAQYALGWMYANGRGVARDAPVAAQLFALAAAQQHQQARTMLRYTGADASAPLPACMQPDPPPPPPPEPPEPPLSGVPGKVRQLVEQLAPGFQVDARLALAIIKVESAFNAGAVSPKNAQGLMQLIPDTARRFRVKDAFDPEQNIRGGLAYLQWLLAYFRGNVPLVAAAYNAGERAVEQHGGVPPYPETQEYVKKIGRLYRPTTHPYLRDLLPGGSLIAAPEGSGTGRFPP
ncbi:MAG: transglycosylase SLT domain-containing protein [Pseudomonadota bacterium]